MAPRLIPPAAAAAACVLQAGLQQAVTSGLVQGWVPKGALKAMQALQKAMELEQKHAAA